MLLLPKMEEELFRPSSKINCYKNTLFRIPSARNGGDFLMEHFHNKPDHIQHTSHERNFKAQFQNWMRQTARKLAIKKRDFTQRTTSPCCFPFGHIRLCSRNLSGPTPTYCLKNKVKSEWFIPNRAAMAAIVSTSLRRIILDD